MKVLIVDDDRFVRQGLRKLLPWEDMDCVIVGEASDGQSGWQLTRELQPDLVITDIRMPGTDGLELARRISESMSGVRLIMLSAYADFEYAQSALKYHVRHYLLKPLSEDSLEQLAGYIRDISSELQKERQYYELRFLDGSDQQRVSKALECADVEKISEFFEKEIPKLGLHISDLRAYCLNLITLLFRYLQGLGLGKGSSDRSKKEAILTLSALKGEQQILSYTYQLYLDTLQFSLQKVSSSDKLALSISQYIADHFCDADLSVAKIAQEFHISPVYAGALFRAKEGMNINQFVSHLRMEKAAELLRDPALRVQDVSGMTGYLDPQYFGKIFKKTYGITPTEFRRITLAPIESS